MLVLVIGAAAICTFDQWQLQRWVASGTSIQIGKRTLISLPAGKSLAYYESPNAVPVSNVALDLRDENGEWFYVEPPTTDISFRLMFGGWSGRALWQLDMPAQGEYFVTCRNHNVTDDSEIPPEDRVAFLKQPDSVEELSTGRKIWQVTAATLVFTLTVACYMLHARQLSLQSRPPLAP